MTGGRLCGFNQNYKSKNCDDILKIIPEEVHVTGNVYDIIEAYLKNKNKHFKILKKNMKIILTNLEIKMKKKKKNFSMKN